MISCEIPVDWQKFKESIEMIQIPSIPKPYFLLIQCDTVLDCQDSPVTLAYDRAEKQADIIVACGIVNEFGQKEICGIVGHYKYRPFARIWELNGQPLSITGKPGIVLRDALYSLRKQGRLSDPVNLGKIVLEGRV